MKTLSREDSAGTVSVRCAQCQPATGWMADEVDWSKELKKENAKLKVSAHGVGASVHGVQNVHKDAVMFVISLLVAFAVTNTTSP